MPTTALIIRLAFLATALTALSATQARADQSQVVEPPSTTLTPQATAPPAAPPVATVAAPVAPPQDTPQPDDDRLPSVTEPDYRVVNLATTLRLPSHRASFELTHRFNGNLREGSFAENASNLFGLDQGAAIGLEFRYAIARHVEAAFYRTNIDKTIQFSTKLDLLHERAGTPVGLSVLISVEGTNNFHTNYQPGMSIVISRAIASRVALYAEPTWVGRTGVEAGVNQGTGFVGLGVRARVRSRMYLVAEVSPRVTGYEPGKPEYGFGLEERVGGHVFQLNFTNTSATTLAEVARGGFPNTLFLGFNLSRKFF
jgi:hypothetical protein